MVDGPYRVEKVEDLMTERPGYEYDVWRSNDSGEPQRLIASYAFPHQAREVVDVLNKWAAAEQ